MDLNNYFKIGVLGPRSFSLGGHDINNDCRKKLRNNISNIINRYKRDDVQILGVTGLGLGVEQDFALCCKANDINYIGILPFPDQEKRWVDLPGVIELYDMLDKSALNTITVGDGNYSPKKILYKDLKIIEASDIIICVVSNIYQLRQEIYDLIEKINKMIVLIKI